MTKVKYVKDGRRDDKVALHRNSVGWDMDKQLKGGLARVQGEGANGGGANG